MTGLDTNVLLRLLVRDDPTQYETAVRFVKDAVSRGETLFINRVVVAELVWALARTYRRSRNDIALAIEQLLMTAEFEVEGSPLAWAALNAYKSTSVDFTDCLVGAVNRAAGCAVTVTFDRAAAKLETFARPERKGRNPMPPKKNPPAEKRVTRHTCGEKEPRTPDSRISEHGADYKAGRS